MSDSATKLARTQEAMASLESEHSTLEASAEAMRSNLIALTSELQRVSEGLRDTQMHAMEANVMREQIKALSSEVI
jgi:predicted RNase H-like nuclease (RuvC/YqgF family)